mmetsp:Transcript_85893/g.152142  ORF Transcript_85893/g.152142 Transcript_85893/m.152142 type:complete len:296 (-) Transcript_85893:59-946(-)
MSYADNEHLLEAGSEDEEVVKPRFSRLQLAALVSAAFCAVAATTYACTQNQKLLKIATGLVQEKYSTTTTWCYEDGGIGDCWSKKPSISTPCTAHSATLACLCPNEACFIDDLGAEPPTTGRCAEKTVYVKNGTKHNLTVSGAIDITGTSTETYCTDMVLNDQWQQKGLTYEEGQDEPPTNGKSYWSCWHPNSWQDGKCQRKERFLGETCWDGSWGAGQCADAEVNYDEYSTSCYKGKCVPFAYAQEREECSCAWFGWNFIVACSAAEGQCGGHACVLSTGDGKKYCDYATDQTW